MSFEKLDPEDIKRMNEPKDPLLTLILSIVEWGIIIIFILSILISCVK